MKNILHNNVQDLTKKELQTIHYAIKADLSMYILTINVIRSKVDLNIESFISIFDCWQGEVR